MAIRQVTTSNTFLQWLIATQALVDAYNYYEVRTNLVFDRANSVSNTANAVNVANARVHATATDIYQYVSTAYGVANSIYVIANNAWDRANAAFALANAATSNLVLSNAIANTHIKANAAYDRANTLFIRDTVNNNVFFITFVASNTTIANIPSVNNGIQVSSTKLTYNPFTGTLNSVDFNSTSDGRLKENLKTISGLDTINKINPYQFTWKDTGKKSYGIIAQEAQNVLPELISERFDGYKGFSYIPLIAILIQSVKELEQKIKDLESK